MVGLNMIARPTIIITTNDHVLLSPQNKRTLSV